MNGRKIQISSIRSSLDNHGMNGILDDDTTKRDKRQSDCANHLFQFTGLHLSTKSNKDLLVPA